MITIVTVWALMLSPGTKESMVIPMIATAEACHELGAKLKYVEDYWSPANRYKCVSYPTVVAVTK